MRLSSRSRASTWARSDADPRSARRMSMLTPASARSLAASDSIFPWSRATRTRSWPRRASRSA